MKTVIVNIGTERLTAAAVSGGGRGEKTVIERLFDIDITDQYSAQATLDIKVVAKLVKENLGQYKHADIKLILPPYVTDADYRDIVTFPEAKPVGDANGFMKSVCIRVGENTTKKVEETISFNQKLLDSIASTFYSNNLNVVSFISASSCYHNYIARFNIIDAFSEDPTVNHVSIVWSPQAINYIVFTGNLPVERIKSEYTLQSVFNDLHSAGSQLSFSKMLKAINLLYVSPDSGKGNLVLDTTGETIRVGKEDIHLDISELDILKSALFSFLNDFCAEVVSIYNHTVDHYGTKDVRICSNSRLIDECLSRTYSADFPIEYQDSPDPIHVGNNEIVFRQVSEITDAMVPIIGAVIETMPKGGDFYATR